MRLCVWCLAPNVDDGSLIACDVAQNCIQRQKYRDVDEASPYTDLLASEISDAIIDNISSSLGRAGIKMPAFLQPLQ